LQRCPLWLDRATWRVSDRQRDRNAGGRLRSGTGNACPLHCRTARCRRPSLAPQTQAIIVKSLQYPRWRIENDPVYLQEVLRASELNLGEGQSDGESSIEPLPIS
jgi:hypothetical protein